jgi:hypothetical protein
MTRPASPLAGKTVTVKPAAPYENLQDGAEYRVEDWWENVYGKSWMDATGNPAALIYGMRSGVGGLPIDDDVLYGKINSLGYLVHVSEIVEKENGQ